MQILVIVWHELLWKGIFIPLRPGGACFRRESAAVFVRRVGDRVLFLICFAPWEARSQPGGTPFWGPYSVLRHMLVFGKMSHVSQSISQSVNQSVTSSTGALAQTVCWMCCDCLGCSFFNDSNRPQTLIWLVKSDYDSLNDTDNNNER